MATSFNTVTSCIYFSSKLQHINIESGNIFVFVYTYIIYYIIFSLDNKYFMITDIFLYIILLDSFVILLLLY